MSALLSKDGFVIVIGASAGGMTAIRQLTSHFDPNIDAAVCIISHLAATADPKPFLARLKKNTTMYCSIAADNMPLKKGHLYMAPADSHMIITDGMILLGRGPAESRWRPSIDVGFRSAAVAWDTHCIGIILSGLLNDGVAGMDAIKRCGGFTITQDPIEAEYPDMPQAVLNNITPSRCLPVNKMIYSIQEYMRSQPARLTPPPGVQEEADLATQVASQIDHMVRPDRRHTVYTCPDCGGGLWEMTEGDLTRYRCHIGHTYMEKDLLGGQGEKIEDTLWIALRMMEERRHLLFKLAGREDIKSAGKLSKQYHDKAEEIQLHVERLKEFLFAYQKANKN